MDTVSPAKRSEIMRNIRSKGTKPELSVRKLVFSLGYRYRLNRKDIPGKPDLIFAGKRKVIFVHGCFWHQHKAQDCNIARKPKSRLDYWLPKLDRNVERDMENYKLLASQGWEYLVVWECELKQADKLKVKIDNFLKANHENIKNPNGT
jgi:DNA mismatch endonuclease (patch repair protein)